MGELMPDWDAARACLATETGAALRGVPWAEEEDGKRKGLDAPVEAGAPLLLLWSGGDEAIVEKSMG